MRVFEQVLTVIYINVNPVVSFSVVFHFGLVFYYYLCQR